MDHVYLRLVSPVTVGVFGIFFLTLFLMWFDSSLGLILGSILLIMLLVWPILFYKLGKRNGGELTQNKADLRVTTLDWIEGYSELTLFGAEERYRNAILETQRKLMANQFVNANLTGMASAALMLFNGLTLVLMLWLAADGVGGNAPDPFIALMAFATMASFELLMPIAGAFQHLGQTLSSARRLNEVILSEPEVQFAEEKLDINKPLDITFSNVTFNYPDSERNVLNAVDLTIPATNKVAIVGQTGSGKSTLIQLLTRYWDPKKGYISIAGIELTQWNESQLRESISVVSQRVDILNGTLRDNLLIARPEATDDHLANILKDVGLEKLLENNALDSWLGDGGRQLSGGEKRRIGIARAILHDAPILLLDEPTEGLDKQTEQSIMTLFEKHFEGKTVIFITHRLIGLESMDSIVLIEQGEIVENGSHEKLLNEEGRYFQLRQAI